MGPAGGPISPKTARLKRGIEIFHLFLAPPGTAGEKAISTKLKDKSFRPDRVSEMGRGTVRGQGKNRPVHFMSQFDETPGFRPRSLPLARRALLPWPGTMLGAIPKGIKGLGRMAGLRDRPWGRAQGGLARVPPQEVPGTPPAGPASFWPIVFPEKPGPDNSLIRTPKKTMPLPGSPGQGPGIGPWLDCPADRPIEVDRRKKARPGPYGPKGPFWSHAKGARIPRAAGSLGSNGLISPWMEGPEPGGEGGSGFQGPKGRKEFFGAEMAAERVPGPFSEGLRRVLSLFASKGGAGPGARSKQPSSAPQKNARGVKGCPGM